MRVLGLDLATCSGYSLIEDGNLSNYGMINIPTEMNLFQRIEFFENNLTKILNDYSPDYVAIEDVIMGLSGVKTLVYLARLNGLALACCCKKVQSNIALYTPSEWKSNSFDGLNGNSKKYEIQIAVCRHFKLIDENLLKEICQPLSSISDNSSIIKKNMDILRQDTVKYIAFLNRKRNGCKTDEDKKSFENKIKENKETIKQYKTLLEQTKKNIEKVYKGVSLGIMSKCGLTCDVSDSVGVAYCLWKKLNQKEL